MTPEITALHQHHAEILRRASDARLDGEYELARKLDAESKRMDAKIAQAMFAARSVREELVG